MGLAINKKYQGYYRGGVHLLRRIWGPIVQILRPPLSNSYLSWPLNFLVRVLEIPVHCTISFKGNKDDKETIFLRKNGSRKYSELWVILSSTRNLPLIKISDLHIRKQIKKTDESEGPCCVCLYTQDYLLS